MQRVRFVSSIFFVICLGCDYMTPYLPHLFVLLAGVANIGKAVSITAYASTQPAIMRSFARMDNLADVTARCQAQNMVVDQLGIIVASSLTWLVRHDLHMQLMLPLVCSPCSRCCLLISLLGGHAGSVNFDVERQVCRSSTRSALSPTSFSCSAISRPFTCEP